MPLSGYDDAPVSGAENRGMNLLDRAERHGPQKRPGLRIDNDGPSSRLLSIGLRGHEQEISRRQKTIRPVDKQIGLRAPPEPSAVPIPAFEQITGYCYHRMAREMRFRDLALRCHLPDRTEEAGADRCEGRLMFGREIRLGRRHETAKKNNEKRHNADSYGHAHPA
ncbi:hypothetical protein Mame01_62820 [Microbispora amethystogenes]|nr:hypothetical protein Mame01_62820 [Microbispora amethystogenes]